MYTARCFPSSWPLSPHPLLLVYRNLADVTVFPSAFLPSWLLIPSYKISVFWCRHTIPVVTILYEIPIYVFIFIPFLTFRDMAPRFRFPFAPRLSVLTFVYCTLFL
ncbi:hypothetical protein HOY82DRAFT_550362, partial [Tuber indicum]